jgi:hypothetical protein
MELTGRSSGIGLALHGDRRDVDRVVEGFVLHP